MPTRPHGGRPATHGCWRRWGPAPAARWCSPWRLAIVDRRPAEHERRVPRSAGMTGWLRARYADPAAWREAGYACLLATVVPALSVAVLFTVTVAGIFIATPVLVGLGAGPVTF